MPKFSPLIATSSPRGAELTDRLLMNGLVLTVKDCVLVVSPPTVTATLFAPLVAFDGTDITMELLLQFVGCTVFPANVTVPGDDPKLVPHIVTAEPAGPAEGIKPVVSGFDTTNGLLLLLADPPTTTWKYDVPVRKVGTTATMEVLLQLVTCATTGDTLSNQSPNLTVPVVAPNPLPVMVTGVPVVPDIGDRLEITGAAWAGRQATTRIKRETTKAVM